MKRLSLSAVLLTLLLPLVAAAQVPVPTPTPNPMVYNDPAMHFEAPAGWRPVGQRAIPVKALGDNPSTVAGWINPDNGHPKTLLIQLQAYDGSLDGFKTTYDEELRSQFDGGLVRHEQPFSLKNGMPAKLLEMTAGSGFQTIKAYICIWIDGQRGVSMVMTGRLGDIDEKTAEAVFATASATAYPAGRDY